MTQVWIMFRSLTHAQTGARLLERSGITATVTRAPQGANPKGCGYAVTIRKRVSEAIGLLNERHIPFGKIVRRLESGEYEEVRG